MATYRRLKGQTDAANASTWSPATAPSAWHATNDSMQMDEGANSPLATNVDTAWAGKSLVNVTITSGCKDDIGSAANPLAVTVSGTVRDYGGGNARYFSGTWVNFEFAPANPNCVCYLSSWTLTGTLYVLAGTMILRGSVILAGVDRIVVSGNAAMEIPEHGSDTIPCPVQLTGNAVLSVKRLVTGDILVGDRARLRYDVKSTTDTGTITLAGGTMELINGSCSVDGQSGVFDWSGLEQAGGYTVDLTEHPALTEKTGAIQPGTFTRTVKGSGSRKV